MKKVHGLVVLMLALAFIDALAPQVVACAGNDNLCQTAANDRKKCKNTEGVEEFEKYKEACQYDTARGCIACEPTGPACKCVTTSPSATPYPTPTPSQLSPPTTRPIPPPPTPPPLPPPPPPPGGDFFPLTTSIPTRSLAFSTTQPATRLPATTPKPRNVTAAFSPPRIPPPRPSNLTNITLPSRKTIDSAEAAALSAQVTAAVGAVVAGVVAASVAASAAGGSAAGAASGAGAIAIIGQVQVLSQLGKIGGGGGALGAFSEGFAWANAELPFSFFPGGNTPVPNSSAADSNATGLRRWLGTSRKSLGQRRKVSPDPGQSVEEAIYGRNCSNETLSAEAKYDCLGCGLVNGIPLLDKAVVICGSLLGVFCVRSLLQCIVTRCLKKDPWDALLFPNWEGPLLLLHWFGMMDSLTTTLGRPCQTWIIISCVFIVVGPALFLAYVVWTIRRHIQMGRMVYHPIPNISWSEMRKKIGEAKGIKNKFKAFYEWVNSRRHRGEWEHTTEESKFWKFLLKDISISSWTYVVWILIRKCLFAGIMALTVGSANAIANIILQFADLSVISLMSPFSDHMLNLQETFSSFSNLVTIILVGLQSILGFMPDMFGDTFLIITALMGTVAAAVVAAAGPIFALGSLVGGAFVGLSALVGGAFSGLSPFAGSMNSGSLFRGACSGLTAVGFDMGGSLEEAVSSFREQMFESVQEVAEDMNGGSHSDPDDGPDSSEMVSLGFTGSALGVVAVATLGHGSAAAQGRAEPQYVGSPRAARLREHEKGTADAAAVGLRVTSSFLYQEEGGIVLYPGGKGSKSKWNSHEALEQFGSHLNFGSLQTRPQLFFRSSMSISKKENGWS